MRILLLRHGQTQGNINGRIQGPDDELTDLGREQARRMATYVASTYDVHHIVSSSLARAKETAQFVVDASNATIAYDARFAEIHNGHAIGMLWTDWREQNPDLAPVWGWDVRHADAAWGGGESGRELSRRVFAAFDDVIAAHKGGGNTIAIVAHGGPIAWLASRINGDSLEVWPGPYGDIANCSVTEVDIDSSGAAYITSWNYTDHLEEVYAPHVSPMIPRVSGRSS